MGGQVRFKRAGWPMPGAVGEQDAVLMQALDLLRDVHDEMERFKARPKPTVPTV